VDGNKAVTRLQFFKLIKPSLTETLNIIIIKITILDSPFFFFFFFGKSNTIFVISDLKTAPLLNFIKIDKLGNISNRHFGSAILFLEKLRTNS
jgi:hypothetical protein